MSELYDQIGKGYSAKRQTDSRLATQIWSHLQGAEKVLNLGAGSGSYEPEDVDLVAVEPSARMIQQRAPNAHPVVQAAAEKLPFEDNAFSHTMTVLSMHHWSDQAQAFSEIRRVTRQKFVAVTWDPAAAPFWLTRDYFPDIHLMDLSIFPSLDNLRDVFDEVEVRPLLIPEDCMDGFLAAYWKRPAAYLDPAVRNSISAFAKLEDVESGLKKLRHDLENGAWEKQNREILTREYLDTGYVVVSAAIDK